MSASSHSPHAERSPRSTASEPERPTWKTRARFIAKLLFFGLIAYLLVRQARAVDWQDVVSAIRRRPAHLLGTAAAFALASHALYSCFDLIGRHLTGHRLATGRVMAINFISYAFNLNMGALIGGVAFRYRLYSRFGLETGTTTRIVVLSMLTNWLGYVALAGFVFLLLPPALPQDWAIDASTLRVLGAGLLVLAAGYLAWCAFTRKRVRTIRGHEVILPPLRISLLQVFLGALNWMLMAAILFVLLEQKIGFATVLSVLLVAAIAGAISHVPAGLGVLEVVFVTFLSSRVPQGELLAALLAYRGLYYLLPLAAAAVLYFFMESRGKLHTTRQAA